MKVLGKKISLIVMAYLMSGIVNIGHHSMIEAAPNLAANAVNTGKAEHLGYHLYKGHMHTHTSLSDGILLPDDAYNYVKANTDFDFYAVTEHDVTYDVAAGNDFITSVEQSYSDEYKLLHAQSNAHNEDNVFVTLPATEVTWYDESGHINLFNAAWFPRTYGEGADGTWGFGDIKYDLPTFYTRLAQDPLAIAQFNHPRSSGNWSFDEFKHYNKAVDKNLNLIEYKAANNFAIYTKALDRGWHIAPVFGGDEHKGQWGTVQDHVTGIWAETLTREGIYDALRNRHTFVSFDRNLIMKVAANGQMMGSILPANTKQINLHINITDPDPGDVLDRVVVYKNNGAIVKQYTNINSNQFETNVTLNSQNGDYYIVRAFQSDGEEAVSAPIWVGEETRGTVHAPTITVAGQYANIVVLGDKVQLLGATAKNHNGQSIGVETIVYNDKGIVPITNQKFSVEMYGDYFIKYKATDSQGNTKVELIRISVANQQLDAAIVLNEFEPTVSVGSDESSVGINVVTDKVLKQAYVQYKPQLEGTWDTAELALAEATYFEAAYGDTYANSNFRVLAGHEVDLTNLLPGMVYEYRYGLSSEGPWSNTYHFKTAPATAGKTMYIMGDLAVPDRNPLSFQLYTNMLNMLRSKDDSGQVVLQVGDLVEMGSNVYPWEDVLTHISQPNQGLITASVVGDREYFTDRKFGTYAGFFNLPKNGAGSYKETNYSFDYGDIHIAVLNTVIHLDKQLEWLESDLRATDKKWKIVVGHYPFYGGQSSEETGMDIMRFKLSTTFERLGVNLYLGGHDRIYKRTTIRGGERNITQEAMNLGTTFVTVGSSGPIFYDDITYDWDHVVYDEKKQTGIVLKGDQTSLTLQAYNSDGVEVDAFTLSQPANYIRLTSAVVENNVLKGAGILNYPGVPNQVTVIAEKRDHAGQLLDAIVEEITLEHLGREQVVLFGSDMSYANDHTVTLALVNNATDRVPLAEPLLVKEGILGDGSVANPFQIKSVAGLYQMQEHPDKHFILTADIDGEGTFFEAIGANGVPFTGVLDGQGHTITGVTISSGGAGIFAMNEGTIRNVGMVNAYIDVRRSNVGILVDQNDGVIEYVYSSGWIKGNSTVGGLVGYSNGVVRDSYSSARVTARGKQAGGVVGITNRGSLTERVYALGAVTAEDSNAGGISGYAYNSTVIQNSVALNPSIVAGASTNRVVSRVLAGETATLLNNYADKNMFISSEISKAEASNNERGQGVTATQITDPAWFAQVLGWNFTSIWTWDQQSKRPLLQSNLEEVSEDNKPKPNLSKNENGYFMIRSLTELKKISEFPDENYILMNDLDFAGKQFESLFKMMPFLGEFDGNNKRLMNFRSESGGLFHLNGGVIKNIAMLDADVSGHKNVGILVNTNNGQVENSYTTGAVYGSDNVGGLVGFSNGIVRNSYSTSNATAQLSQAGGLIGITNAGSLTENVYATGIVQSLKSNAGGVTGYGYNNTVVKNVIALNSSVIAPTMANRVVGRVLAGHTATLSNNYSFADMTVNVEGETQSAANNRRGIGLSLQEIQDIATYSTRLNWDFSTVWMWDSGLKRPILQSVPESVSASDSEPLVTWEE